MKLISSVPKFNSFILKIWNGTKSKKIVWLDDRVEIQLEQPGEDSFDHHIKTCVISNQILASSSKYEVSLEQIHSDPVKECDLHEIHWYSRITKMIVVGVLNRESKSGL
ncbi:hypothetical protein H4Q26_010962 [Puccinia striiformis f. sp. tritici PST-130]|nr:hypothetical protein H4Q26_010962 [Puccinia striiformis f. sp. tritici PST-130]